MEAFLILSGFALCLIGIGIARHGLPSIVHIEHNTYNNDIGDVANENEIEE